MQLLFGTIIILQILAHFPLIDIVLPSNVMQTFNIMVKVVSFDYFPVFDYWEVGFTETEPWS